MSTEIGGEEEGIGKKKESGTEELYIRTERKIYPRDPALYRTEEFLQYTETIRKSGGFTVPPLGKLAGLIRKDIYRCTYDARGMEILTKLSQVALDKFNKDRGTDYKLEKVDRGNWKMCGSYFYFYITFVASKESSEQVKESVEIQAIMLRHEVVPEVLLCLPREDMDALIQKELALAVEKEGTFGNKRKLSLADLETEKKCKSGKGAGGTGEEKDEEESEEEDG